MSARENGREVKCVCETPLARTPRGQREKGRQSARVSRGAAGRGEVLEGGRKGPWAGGGGASGQWLGAQYIFRYLQGTWSDPRWPRWGGRGAGLGRLCGRELPGRCHVSSRLGSGPCQQRTRKALGEPGAAPQRSGSAGLWGGKNAPASCASRGTSGAVWCRLVPSGGAAGLWRVAAGDTAEQGTCTAAAPTTERGGGHRPARPQPRKPEVEGTAEAEAPRKSRAEFGGGAGSRRGGRGLRPSKRARWFQVLLCRREDLLSRHASRPPETDMVPGTRERPVQSPKPPGLAG